MTAHPTDLAPAADLAPGLPNEAPWLESSFTEARRLRHDGWDGARMASFCATLAETGVVTEACRAAGMSAQSAYALRHRDPVFAGAWAAALAKGRERLADDLLARAMKGEVVQVWQNGCIVAEQHRFDNKLALAILRRLDPLAETGATSTAPRRAAGEGTPAAPAATPALNGGWPDLLTALEADRPHEALTLLRGPETVEVDNPLVQPLDAAERAELEQLRARYRAGSRRPRPSWTGSTPPSGRTMRAPGRPTSRRPPIARGSRRVSGARATMYATAPRRSARW